MNADVDYTESSILNAIRRVRLAAEAKKDADAEYGSALAELKRAAELQKEIAEGLRTALRANG